MAKVTIKKPDELAKIREGGHLLAVIRDALADMALPGVTTADLEAEAVRRMKEMGAEPAFIDYRVKGVTDSFPSAVCLSINEEVVHAPSVPSRTLAKGDVLGIDIGMKYKGLYTDTAVTLEVGRMSREAGNLILITKLALQAGIEAVAPGQTVTDISRAVEAVIKKSGYGIVRDLVGHGVGYAVHEEPKIPNYVDPRLSKVVLREGMVLAIEPMVTLGSSGDVRTLSDGWTVVSVDGTLAAHFEHTVIVSKDGAEVVTV